MSIRTIAFSLIAIGSPLAGHASADDGEARVRLGHTKSAAEALSHRGERPTGDRVELHSRGRPVHTGHAAGRTTVHRHSESCRYDAGHYDVRIRKVHVPGHYVERTLPAEYEVRWDRRSHGFIRVLIRSERIVRTWVPSHYDERRERIWVPGVWVCKTVRTERSRGRYVDRHDHGHTGHTGHTGHSRHDRGHTDHGRRDDRGRHGRHIDIHIER